MQPNYCYGLLINDIDTVLSCIPSGREVGVGLLSINMIDYQDHEYQCNIMLSIYISFFITKSNHARYELGNINCDLYVIYFM